MSSSFDDNATGAFEVDPWSLVDDIDGDVHYKVLGVSAKASVDEIKTAYRKMARTHHPDKGGSAETFHSVQQAFRVLSDPDARKVYDRWASELQYRYVRGIAPRMEGGEDLLLDEFEALGLSCDPTCQLVITCETCGRPSNWDCYVCGMRQCDFCGRKQHWKGTHGLHWPMRNMPGMMSRKLAEKELEKKRIDDAKKLALADPNYRSEPELEVLRAFKEAAREVDALPRDRRVRHYDHRIGKFYLWTQTQTHVYVALHVPTGYQDRNVGVECDGTRLTVQAERSPKSIDRVLSNAISRETPISSFQSDDNRFTCIILQKQEMGKAWKTLFHGDSDGMRSLEPPYRLIENADDVIFELDVPFWIDAEDVDVRITDRHLTVRVRNEYDVRREFWRNKEMEETEARGGASYPGPVDPTNCAWSLDEEQDANGDPIKVVMVHLAKPARTAKETTFEGSKRNDNLHQRRKDGQGIGVRYFIEDEDDFDLEDTLNALTFFESGSAYVRRKPYEREKYGEDDPGWVTDLSALSKRASTILEGLLDGEDESAAAAE